MKKIWETKEWKKASEGKKGDKCEQCGSIKNLSIHHEISFRNLVFLKWRELAIKQMCKEMGARFFPSSLNQKGGFSCSKGHIKANIFRAYVKEHPEFKIKADELAKIEYLSLSNTKTLCKKCHFATENGLILCDYCKKRYYNPIKFMSCSDCKEKAEREYERFGEELEKAEEKMFAELDSMNKENS